MGWDPWEPKGPHVGGTLGNPRDPMGGDPWETKGTHGRGPLGAQRITWERNHGDPNGGELLGTQGMGPLGAQRTHGMGT